MRVPQIKTGNKTVDRLLTSLVKRAIRLNKLKTAQKAGIKKRQIAEAKAVKSFTDEFKDYFTETKYQYKTLKGAQNYLIRKFTREGSFSTLNLPDINLRKVSSIEKPPSRAELGLPPLNRFQAKYINVTMTKIFNEEGIKGKILNELGIAEDLREELREKYFESEQWKLHRTWRHNRDEAKLYEALREGIINTKFEKLDVSKYKPSSLAKHYYDPEIRKAMFEYEKRYGPIPYSKKQGWTNIYNGFKKNGLFEQYKEIHGMDELESVYKAIKNTDSQGRIDEDIYLSDLLSPTP